MDCLAIEDYLVFRSLKKSGPKASIIDEKYFILLEEIKPAIDGMCTGDTSGSFQALCHDLRDRYGITINSQKKTLSFNKKRLVVKGNSVAYLRAEVLPFLIANDVLH
jgi:hypothetical protein